MAEHTFLLLEALWRTEGEFFDGTGNRAEVEGEAAIRHYPDKWIYEGSLRTTYEGVLRTTYEGVLRTRAPRPVEHRTVYEIQPLAPGNFATGWTSQSERLGSLQGRFLLVGDAILSAYESAAGRYRGQDTILRRDERHYSARGALFDGGKLISAWAVELARV